MEPFVAASAFTRRYWSVRAAGGVLCLLAFAATGHVVARTVAEADSRPSAAEGWLGVAFTSLLTAAGFVRLLMRWAFAVACVGCLLALLAVASRYGQGTSLRGYLEAPGGEEEPAWWPAFETGFRRYASALRREQNPLRRAVTRPTSRAVDTDGTSADRRSPDVMAGGRP